MQALCSHQHKYPALPLGTNSHFHAVLACKLNWWSSMQVSGSSCDVLAHARSLIVNRMSHLNYLLPHSCHVHVWYQLSIDAQWVSSACNWIVFVVLFGCKGLCSGQTCGMLCTGIFWLGTGTLQDEQNLHTCYIYPCFCEPIWAESSSCIGLEAYVHHSSGVLASAWFVVFSFCTCHLVIQCTADAWGWSGLHGSLLPLALYVWLWPLNFPSSWQVGAPCLLGTYQGPHCLYLLFWKQSPHLSEKKTNNISMKYLGCLWWVFGKIDLTSYNIKP